MSRRSRRVARWVDDVLHNRRPRSFRGAEDEKDVLAAAIDLRSGAAGAGLPDPQFVDALRHRLARETQGEVAPTRHLSRRTVLVSGGLAAATAAAGIVLGERIAAPQSPPTELTPEGGTWTAVAALTEVPEGTAKLFDTGSVRGVVVNTAGEITALSAVCTHLGCLLQLDTGTRRLNCPCHRAAFTLDGSVLFKEMPDSLPPLPRLASRVRDGAIEVMTV